jgi:O-antigen/teichoic acid export membrane protein
MVMLFAPEGLALWISQEFADQSADVLRWLALGVYINCVARLPFIALQSHGRPDLTAKLHLAELPVYLGVLWLLLQQFGIAGAAMAWTLRIAVDALALFLLGMRIGPGVRAACQRALALTTLATLVLAALWLPEGLPVKVGLGATALLVSGYLGWRQVGSIAIGLRKEGEKSMTIKGTP